MPHPQQNSQNAESGVLWSIASGILNVTTGPVAMNAVGQTFAYLMNIGEKSRKQIISNILQEEQFRNKILLCEEQQALDRVKFDENSIPLGSLGEEIFLDGDKLIYYSDDQYNVFDLSQPAFKTMYAEETSNNSKIIAVAITAITAVKQSAFLSDEQKNKLNDAINKYITSAWMDNGSVNWITGIFRAIGNSISREKLGNYTYEELEQAYKDYQADKSKKTDGFFSKVKYFFGSHDKEKNRYIEVAESFDKLKQELDLSLKEIKLNLQQIKDQCIQKLSTMNVFKDKRKSELLSRVTKSKVLLQRLYLAYKSNGKNLDDALFDVACELYRKNELDKSKSFLPVAQYDGIRKIEKQHMQYATSDEEVNEQVRRYFNFDPHITKSIKIEECEMSIDKYSKTIEIQEKLNGVYYLDFNQLRNDINKSDKKHGAIMYYNLLLETLRKIANTASYMVNPKNAKIMQYIEDTIAKMENKSLKDEEYEYLPNMLFHWISSLANKPLSKQDVNKKIVTITLMDNDGQGKTSDNINERNENIDDFHNVSFDIFDPKTEKIKMGTIIRKGEKIYYKEDPGFKDFKVISAEDLLKKLNVESLQGKDIESEYVGDCWQMRKMLYFVQKLRDKERQAKVNDGENIKQTLSYVSDDTADEERKAYSQTRVNTEEDIEKNDFSIKNVSNSMPINTLKEQSVIFPDGNNNNDIMSQSGNGDGKQNFTGNANGNISYSKPSMNLQNENLSATLNQ